MASDRDSSYMSSEMGGEGRQQGYLSPAKGYQGRDMSYNNSGEYTGQTQQKRHDEFIDQVSTFPGQNNQEYLQQIKTEEYLNQRNNMSGKGTNNNILQQTGEGVMHAAQGALCGAANMAHGAAAGAANIAQGAASAVKHTLGMDPDPHDSPYSTSNTGLPTHYAAGTNYSGNPTATSGHHATNYTTGSDYPASGHHATNYTTGSDYPASGHHATNYTTGSDYTASGHHASNYTTGSDYPSYANKND